MTKKVHVHLHPSRDAQWEESKHPRDGGKFASKPGAGAQTEAVRRQLKINDLRAGRGEHAGKSAVQRQLEINEAARGLDRVQEHAKKLRASYQEALKVGNMAEARRLLRELKKAEAELEKGGSGK